MMTSIDLGPNTMVEEAGALAEIGYIRSKMGPTERRDVLWIIRQRPKLWPSGRLRKEGQILAFIYWERKSGVHRLLTLQCAWLQDDLKQVVRFLEAVNGDGEVIGHDFVQRGIDEEGQEG